MCIWRKGMVLEQIKGKLVVSCQALPHEPLHSSYIMSRMAVAAMEGGAAGIRAQSAQDINAIAQVCHLPIIGIVKRNYDDSEIYITPTMKEIDELLTTRAEIIAMDATDRKRPGGILTKELVDRVHEAVPASKDKKIIFYAPTFRGRIATAVDVTITEYWAS